MVLTPHNCLEDIYCCSFAELPRIIGAGRNALKQHFRQLFPPGHLARDLRQAVPWLALLTHVTKSDFAYVCRDHARLSDY
jgi:hypothetical protein